MQPFSLPVEKPQPNQQFYGAVDLQLFRTFSREEYLAEFGIEPPPYNPAKPSKRWFDSSVDLSEPEEYERYNTVRVGKDGVPRMAPLYLTRADAAAVNIPGRNDSAPNDVPLPLRPLKENEKLRNTPFGWQVYREDINPHAGKTDRALLEEIHGMLSKLTAGK